MPPTQLLRLNYVSVHQLFDIKRRFLELDLDGSGTINRDELVATGGEAMGEHSSEIQHALEAMDEIMEEVARKKMLHSRVPPS
jgi:Ca2+-binding EF-hand superfamily protein